MTGEEGAIARTNGGPVTSATILEGLRRLGVRSGAQILVHSSLSSLGFVAGGAQAVVAALRAAVGAKGLLVTPAFTTHLSDPAHWRAPRVPAQWWAAIKTETPAFDPSVTPSRRIGAVSELLRTTPGARRGPHPQVSFAALGRGADEVVSNHAVRAWLGDGSPLQRLYDRDAEVLFVGTSYATCTAFHLGEHRAASIAFRPDGAPMMAEGTRAWANFDAPDYKTDAYALIGAAFEAQGGVRTGRIGAAPCRLFKLRHAADFAQAFVCKGREGPARAQSGPFG